MLTQALRTNYAGWPDHSPAAISYKPRIQAIELEYKVYSNVKTMQAYKLAISKKVRVRHCYGAVTSVALCSMSNSRSCRSYALLTQCFALITIFLIYATQSDYLSCRQKK